MKVSTTSFRALLVEDDTNHQQLLEGRGWPSTTLVTISSLQLSYCTSESDLRSYVDNILRRDDVFQREFLIIVLLVLEASSTAACVDHSG